MPIKLHDRYAFDDAAKVTITKDGYLTATPRVARTGIQLYYGSELGLADSDPRYNKVLRVLRPESAVFSTDSMASYAYKPVTDDHPPVNVGVQNWRDYARGQLSGDVARDGQFIRVPMALMDGGLVQKYKDGKKELSMGYECEIIWGAGSAVIDGVTVEFDAQQDHIRINHCAVVDAARGGKDLKIGDGTGSRVDFNVYAMALDAIASGNVIKDQALADITKATCLVTDSKGMHAYPILKDGQVFLNSLRANKTDAVTKGDGDALAALDNLLARAEGNETGTHDAAHTMETTTMPKIVNVDSIPVEFVNDQGAAIVQRALDTAAALVKKTQDAYTEIENEKKVAQKKLETDTAEHVTTMATKDAEIATLKKQLEDAKVTPALLDKMVADRGEVFAKAKAVMPNVVTDGKDTVEVMRQVVDAKLGDKAKGWTEDQVRASFAAFTADVKPGAGGTPTYTAPLVGHRPGGVQDQALAFSGTQMADTDARIAARDKRTSEAWKTPQPAAH